jgi:hypothetical protein
MAGGFPLPALRWLPVGGALLRWLWLSNFSYSRHDLPGHAYSAIGVVSSRVAGNHPEEWCQRTGVAASAGTEGLNLTSAQIANTSAIYDYQAQRVNVDYQTGVLR